MVARGDGGPTGYWRLKDLHADTNYVQVAVFLSI